MAGDRQACLYFVEFGEGDHRRRVHPPIRDRRSAGRSRTRPRAAGSARRPSWR
jgi:hypothetical protein